MACNLPIYIKRESQFVGIGTALPTAKLHVQGDIVLTGQMFNADGEPYALSGSGGGGGGGTWVARTSNLPLLVAPSGLGAVIEIQSNVCLQRYGGNDNAYQIYTTARVISAPSDGNADYKISLPDLLKNGAYAPETTIGELWLRATSNSESLTFKAVAQTISGVQDMAYVRFLSGTTRVPLGRFAAGHLLELQGIIAYATEVSTASTSNVIGTEAVYIPGASVQWSDVGYPHPNVFGVGGSDFVITTRKGQTKYVGDDIAFKVSVAGNVAVARNVSQSYYLALPYPVNLGVYGSNVMVGEFVMRVTYAGVGAGGATYRAYARTVSHTDSAVELRYINGTFDVSLYDIEVGSTIDLQGALNYKTTAIASVAIPYAYIPNSLVQDSAGNVGVGTSLTPAKLTVGGDLRVSGSLASGTGSNVLVVDGAGNVGVGTGVPRAKLEVAGNILPSSNLAYDLGSSILRWRDLYLSGNTIDLGGTLLKRDEAGGGGIKVLGAGGADVDTTVRNLNASGYVNIGGTRLERHATGAVMVRTTAGDMESGMFKHVYVDGLVRASNLEVLGEYVTLNTVTSNTEQVVVTNAGTGPGLKVTQTGANSIAEFYDDGGVLAMKVADGGNVGIGTANPMHKLHVIGNINYTGTLYQNGTPFSGGTSSQWTTSSADIYYSVGNVGIGTTTIQARLDVGPLTSLSTAIIRSSGAGSVETDWPSGWGGGLATWDICCASIKYGGLLQRSSDERKKQDITPYPYGLEKLLQLNPVYFRWKKEFGNSDDLQTGFIAQAVEQVLPDTVSEDSASYKTIKVDVFTPLLVNAVKDLHERLQKTEAELVILKTRLGII